VRTDISLKCICVSQRLFPKSPFGSCRAPSSVLEGSAAPSRPAVLYRLGDLSARCRPLDQPDLRLPDLPSLQPDLSLRDPLSDPRRPWVPADLAHRPAIRHSPLDVRGEPRPTSFSKARLNSVCIATRLVQWSWSGVARAVQRVLRTKPAVSVASEDRVILDRTPWRG